MFYILCLVMVGAGTYLYNFGFKQKSLVVRLGGAVVSLGAIALIVLTAIFGHIGRVGCKHHMGEEGKPMCPMMEKMEGMQGGCGCGCMGDMNKPTVEIQRPPIGPEKYHQPVRHLMTDPMESQPKK